MLRHAQLKVICILMITLSAVMTYADIPRLVQQGSATQLMVKSKPMLLLAGELGNSSASDAKYMAGHWAKLKQMHLNTVLVPAYWELIEPVEGQFDWSSVDTVIKSAHANDLKLVLLWFGAWKNSMSTYAPSWVKRNPDRFPYAKLSNGSSVEILSAFVPATRDADAHAFAALMKHIRQVDEKNNTVLMMQVENEIGMLPVVREYGAHVDELFRNEQVPQSLIDRLDKTDSANQTDLFRIWKEQGSKRAGTWSNVFGGSDAAAEVFQAWHYAQYVEVVTQAGKAVYPLPMYINVALNRPGKAPGEYPSGGPLPHLIEVWKAGAPAIDMISPDIYFPNFVDLVSTYKRKDNPLFIPEANNADRPEVPANAFYAIGKHDAIGFGPFSIESIDDTRPNKVAEAYAVLEQLSPSILAAQGSGRTSGFKPRVSYDGTVIDAPVTEVIGNYKFTVSFVDPHVPNANQDTASHGGIIIQTGDEDYLIAGQGLTVTFAATGQQLPLVGIDVAEEGTFDKNGSWVGGRRLNGDQTHQGRRIRLEPGKFQIQRVKLYRYR